MANNEFQKTHQIPVDSVAVASPRASVKAEVKEPPKQLELEINQDAPGQMTVAEKPIEAELVEVQEQEDRLVKLGEKLAGMVSSFFDKAEDRLGKTEEAIASLLDGNLTVAQLAQSYGSMTLAESTKQRDELQKVLNSIAVQADKVLVERAGMRLEKERAWNALTSLQYAFELQAKAEVVGDAQDERDYQIDKRAEKNVTRHQDIDYRKSINTLDKEDKDSRVAHKKTMNSLGDRWRSAIRRGVEADVQVKEYKTEQRVTSRDRILGKLDEKQAKGKPTTKGKK